MQSSSARWILAVALAVTLATNASATTWGPQDFVCPICKTTNTFQVIGSYGSYIYHWPSKFQYVYWPHTDGNVLYSCKKCHLTAFMSDFDDLPADRLPAVEAALAKERFGPWPGDYAKIPMSERLATAEKVYSVLGRDDEWWCHFYRVVGYHNAAEDKTAEAAAARGKALALAEKLAANASLAPRRKEFLYVVGAMRFFGNEDEDGALRAFEEALRLTWSSPELEKEQSEGFDGYLSELLKQSIEGIADVRRARTKPAAPPAR